MALPTLANLRTDSLEPQYLTSTSSGIRRHSIVHNENTITI